MSVKKNLVDLQPCANLNQHHPNFSSIQRTELVNNETKKYCYLKWPFSNILFWPRIKVHLKGCLVIRKVRRNSDFQFLDPFWKKFEVNSWNINTVHLQPYNGKAKMRLRSGRFFSIFSCLFTILRHIDHIQSRTMIV